MKQLERLRVVAEVVGFVAVVMSIVFLALEIRQNTAAMRAAGIQEATNVARQQLLMLVTDADAHRIEMQGHVDPKQLTPGELRRYRYMIRSFWLGMLTVSTVATWGASGRRMEGYVGCYL